MRYELRHMQTVAGTGCFSACPSANLSFNEQLDHLRANPLDEFMHRFIFDGMASQRPRKLEKMIKAALNTDPVLEAVLMEAVMFHPRLSGFSHYFQGRVESLKKYSPMIHLRHLCLEDQDRHNEWIDPFSSNISQNEPLPAPDQAGLEPPFDPAMAVVEKWYGLDRAVEDLKGRLPVPKPRIPVTETYEKAMAVLDKVGVFIGREMRHQSCLATIAMLRNWIVDTKVTSGTIKYSLSGIQTSYGRGFEMDVAKASYAMEVAERVSSYGSVNSRGVAGLDYDAPVIKASMSRMKADGKKTLDLDRMRLEVPYEDQEIHWMPGTGAGGGEVWIPVQLVYLFMNLDEQSLVSGLGSTGLASGNDLIEAKLSGLLEACERDAEATQPYHPSRLFTIDSDDPQVKQLFLLYKEYGVNPVFMDITPEFGVPCYKAFVTDEQGLVSRGTGAGLSGKRAAISAMTEIPYPMPGPKTLPAPEGLPVRKLEDLPDFSTGSAEGDLMVLEKTLVENGFEPAYAELTRKDLKIPAVRALVNGFELVSDFDRFSRLSPRLYANYLGLYSQKG